MSKPTPVAREILHLMANGYILARAMMPYPHFYLWHEELGSSIVDGLTLETVLDLERRGLIQVAPHHASRVKNGLPYEMVLTCDGRIAACRCQKCMGAEA